MKMRLELVSKGIVVTVTNLPDANLYRVAEHRGFYARLVHLHESDDVPGDWLDVCYLCLPTVAQYRNARKLEEENKQLGSLYESDETVRTDLFES